MTAWQELHDLAVAERDRARDLAVALEHELADLRARADAVAHEVLGMCDCDCEPEWVCWWHKVVGWLDGSLPLPEPPRRIENVATGGRL